MTGTTSDMEAEGITALAASVDEPVVVRGQRVNGRIDLSHRTITRDLIFIDCRFDALDLSGSHLSSLSIEDCTISRGLDLSRIVTDGHVRILASEIGAIDLRGAQIGGEAIVSMGGTSPHLDPGARFRDYRLNGDSVRVGGNLRIRVAPEGGRCAGPIRLRGARIGLECSIEGTVTSRDYGGRSVYIGQAAVGDALVIQVDAAGSLDLAMGTFGSVWMDHGNSLIDADLPRPPQTRAVGPAPHGVALTLNSSSMSGDLSLAGGSFQGGVVLDGIQVGGDLFVKGDDGNRTVRVERSTEATDDVPLVSMRGARVVGTFAWYPEILATRGAIDFRNSSVAVLDDSDDDGDTYKRLGSRGRQERPEREAHQGFWRTSLPMRLDGFQYASVAGVSGQSLDVRSVADWVASRLDWIRSGWMSTDGARTVRSATVGGFSTSPYLHLAEVVGRAGYHAAARDILYSMRLDAQRYGPRQPLSERMIGSFLRVFVGWGYRPARAIAWGIAGLVGGSLVFAALMRAGVLVASDPATVSFDPVAVSLVQLIPGLDVATQGDYRISVDGLVGWLGLLYMYAHHLLGWAIGIGLTYSAVERIRGER